MRDAQWIGFRWLTSVVAVSLVPVAFLSTGTSDVVTQTDWLQAAVDRGPVDGYDSVLDYPPGTTLVFWVANMTFGLPVEHTVKLISVLALWVGAVVLGRLNSYRSAFLTVVAFAYPTAVLGYTDALSLVPLAAALLCRPWKIRLVAVVALVALKWTALVLCPVFLALWLADVRLSDSSRWRRAATDALPAIFLATAFVVAYGPRMLLSHLEVASKTTSALSANAFNIHWLVSWFWLDGAPYGAEVYETVPGYYRPLFQVVVIVVIVGAAVACWVRPRGPRLELVSLRLAVSAYFLLAAFSVHENHLFVAVWLTILLWDRYGDSWILAVLISFSYLFNMFLYYGPGGTSRPLYSLGQGGLLFCSGVVFLLVVMLFRDIRVLARRPAPVELPLTHR